MFEGFATGYAFGTPGGIGFLLVCLGVFFWDYPK